MKPRLIVSHFGPYPSLTNTALHHSSGEFRLQSEGISDFFLWYIEGGKYVLTVLPVCSQRSDWQDSPGQQCCILSFHKCHLDIYSRVSCFSVFQNVETTSPCNTGHLEVAVSYANIPSHSGMLTNILYHVTNQGGQGGATTVQLTGPQGSPQTYMQPQHFGSGSQTSTNTSFTQWRRALHATAGVKHDKHWGTPT